MVEEAENSDWKRFKGKPPLRKERENGEKKKRKRRETGK